jgi:hypothetical protein
MGSDDDYDFTSAGGNYYQHGKITHKPLELPSVDWRARWREERDRAEKAEAERDEARARFNDKDLCLHGQAPCEDLLAAERTAYSAGWIAGRDAAVSAFTTRYRGYLHIESLNDIRALTPPEDKP